MHYDTNGTTVGKIFLKETGVSLELLSAIASSNSYVLLVLSRLPACIHTSINAR